MSRINTGVNKWQFQADPAYTWTDLALELIYFDDPVLGSNKTDGVSSPPGLPPSKWNLLYEDLYNRLGYVKRQAEIIGNRGYSERIIINASRSLTIDDSGIISVITTTVGSSPSTAVELTLPTRAGLITAGIGYVESIAIAPFLNVFNAGIAPFVIEGYCTSAGVPLKVSVANPTSPGSPVTGDDMAQSIKIGSFSATSVYLFDGEYAEFIPIILRNASTGLWYTEWHIRVHNTTYGKFQKGGGDTGVTVGAALKPSTNYEKKGDYYVFNIDNLTNLSFMPDNQMGEGKLVFVRMNFSSPSNGGFLLHNQGSVPSGYKPILTPSATNVPMRQDEVVAMIEEAAAWRVVCYFGNGNNFNSVAVNLTTAINLEVAARNAAITAAIALEATARDAAIGVAITAEEVARDAAIGVAIAQEVTDRNTAIGVETTRAETAEDTINHRFDIEAWTGVGAGGTSFASGWGNASGYEVASFRKSALGFVYLKGSIAVATTPAGGASTLFTLPSGYRPSARRLFAINARYDTGSTYVVVQANIEIQTNGTVTIYIEPAITQSSLKLGLDGVFFDL